MIVAPDVVRSQIMQRSCVVDIVLALHSEGQLASGTVLYRYHDSSELKYPQLRAQKPPPRNMRYYKHMSSETRHTCMSQAWMCC
jgi:hypothetical protein